MSFLSCEALKRIDNDNVCRRINAVLDWNKLSTILGDVGRGIDGPRGYPPLSLFKAILLQQWYSLSDPGLEESL